jgi:hypothetical protein
MSKPTTRKKMRCGYRPPQGYKQHVEGSRKSKVHQLYDKEGPEAAWTLGLKLKLKEGSLRNWFGVWRRDGKKGKTAKPKPEPKVVNAVKAPEEIQPTVNPAIA